MSARAPLTVGQYHGTPNCSVPNVQLVHVSTPSTAVPLKTASVRFELRQAIAFKSAPEKSTRERLSGKPAGGGSARRSACVKSTGSLA